MKIISLPAYVVLPHLAKTLANMIEGAARSLGHDLTAFEIESVAELRAQQNIEADLRPSDVATVITAIIDAEPSDTAKREILSHVISNYTK